MPGGRKELRNQNDHARLYADMVATLQGVVDERRLGDLFCRIRSAGVTGSLPVAQDAEVLRMLKRMGILANNCEPAHAQKLTEEFVRVFAEQVSRTPAEISLLLRMLASGMYGIMERGICSSTPDCGRCGITRFCEYYNHTPGDSSLNRIPASKRFLRGGEGAVTDQELLALILGGNRPSADNLTAAEALLRKFGSLRGIINATFQELSSLCDVSESVAYRLAAAAALHRRVTDEKRITMPAVRSGKDFFDLFHHKLRDKKKEIFYVILLDQQNRIITEEEISVGTLISAQVHPREVFAPAIKASAAAIAFVHNHPSGESTPSENDINLTKRLCEAGKMLGIRVLDHVIIGDGKYTSFVDEGIL